MPRSSFELWDAKSNSMKVVPGSYEVMVGSSSADKDLKTITVKNPIEYFGIFLI